MKISQPVVITLFYGTEAEARHVGRILENLDIISDIIQCREKHPTIIWKIVFASRDPVTTVIRNLFQRKSVPTPLYIHTFDPQHQPEIGWESSANLALKELLIES